VIGSERDASNGVLVRCEIRPGANPPSLDHLFNAFLHDQARGHGHGTIDLPSIIEAHGGRVWATANVPNGAIFQFTLPVQRDIEL